jgi:hypothetical protein
MTRLNENEYGPLQPRILPVCEIDLRRLEDNVLLARLVLRERFVSIVLAAVERQMDIGVDQPGQNPLATRVDLPRVGGNRHDAARPDSRDAPAVDQHDAIGQRRPTIAIDHDAADNRGTRAWRLRERRRARDQAGRGDDQSPEDGGTNRHFFVASGRSSRLPHSSHAP